MIPILLVFFVLLADIITKYWVHANLPLMLAYPQYPYGGIGVFHDFAGIEFSISHLTNKGAAWGVLTGYQGALVGGRILLILGLIAYICRWNKHTSWRVPLVLIVAGAIGNVIDYFVYGHVVDMLHFVLWGYDFPVFNVADSAVTIGVFWLILLSTFQNEDDKVPV